MGCDVCTCADGQHGKSRLPPSEWELERMILALRERIENLAQDLYIHKNLGNREGAHRG